MSQFDPESFLDATTDTADEKRKILPTENPEHASGYYLGVIGALKPDSGVSTKDPSNPRPWARIDISVKVQVPASLQNELNLNPELTIRDGVMLDLTTSGAIDNGPGKNNRRRMYREATDLNRPGESFNFRQLEGKTVMVKLKHELFNNEPREAIAAVFKA